MAIALGLVKVSKRFGAQPILEELSFGLQMGEKVGLIGRNGAGKSTLFKLLAAEDSPDSGEVVLTQGLRVAHLSQDPHFAPDATVRSALESALADHRTLLRRHAEIHELLQQEAAREPAVQERLHTELDAVEHHLGHMGWDLEPRLKEAQTTWGLLDLEATVASLSGGWRKRVALAQAWLQDPDVLVMDEPTNHLDPEQVEKLELWLQQFGGALLLITHDRHLLDGVVDRMLELENGSVTSYDGSYSDYLLERADKEFREARLTEHMQNRLRRELAWLRRGAKARTRKSKLRINDVLDLKDDVQDRSRVEERQALTFTGGSNRSDSLITVEDLGFRYPGGAADLAGGLSLYLQRGQRIAILGPNGCGKSTLLKLLLGELAPTSGSISRHPKLSISAISQGRGELLGDQSIADNIAERASMVRVGGQELLVLVYLTRFGFPADQQKRLASTLSGGERNRLLMAKAMLQPADLLVLDEPTNDLDIPTLQNLEEALMDYPGTLLLVSHDRFFLDQVSTHTLAWNPSGSPRWELYEGNPTSVRRLRAERAQEAAADPAPVAAAKAAARPAPRRKAGLSQKEERRLAELEAAMDQLHARIAQLETALGDPGAFITADAPGHQALRERDAAQAGLEELELEWLSLEEKRGSD
jgi:ATP-binding cassette subfamily F protein uup